MHFRSEEPQGHEEDARAEIAGVEPAMMGPTPSVVRWAPSEVHPEGSLVRAEPSYVRSEASAIHSEASVRPARSRASSADDLLVDLEPELLRGVPVHVCLRRFGKEWKNTGPGAWRPQLSKQTQQFRFFFSHDWGTSRWLKYLTLLVFFNSWPAALASFFAGIMFSVLKVLGMLGDSGWWIILQHALAMFVLFFWQNARRLFRPAPLAFLDRLCIPQDDDDVKNRCIYGLASFLNHSENLVVLWSPRYFSRLWCTYPGLTESMF